MSSDNDKSGFDEYLGEMPWCVTPAVKSNRSALVLRGWKTVRAGGVVSVGRLAMPFDKRAEKAELSDLFGVEGVCPDFLQTKRSQTLPSSHLLRSGHYFSVGGRREEREGQNNVDPYI